MSILLEMGVRFAASLIYGSDFMLSIVYNELQLT